MSSGEWCHLLFSIAIPQFIVVIDISIQIKVVLILEIFATDVTAWNLFEERFAKKDMWGNGIGLLFYRLRFFSSIFTSFVFFSGVGHQRMHIFMAEFCYKEVAILDRVASAQNSWLSWSICFVRFLNLLCFAFRSHLSQKIQKARALIVALVKI